MTLDERVTRRRFIGAAAATAAIGSVAGCADYDEEAGVTRPNYGADPSVLNPMLQYIVRSVHYQNVYFDTNGQGDLPDRPTFSGSFTGHDRELNFILQSLEYQNAHVEARTD